MNQTNFNPERLAERRTHLGLTKQQAAALAGLTQPTYLRYENGDRVPSLHVIRTLAESFGTSVDYLTNATDNPSPDFYVISKAADRDLFQIVERLKTDEDFMSRMLAYAQELTRRGDRK